MLADVWGKLYLFHPRVISSPVDWNRVLTDTIPKVEHAKGTDDLIAILNDSLFAPLDDPFTLAQKHEPDSAPLTQRALFGRKLSPAIGYIDATAPREYGSDPAGRISQILESLGPLQKVIVDLRFAVPQYANLDWLRLFLDSTQSRGGLVRREHRGWNERNVPWKYFQQWTVTSPSALNPVPDKRPISIPAVFVVNCFSYKLAADALDVLQASGRGIVILESQCRFPADDVQRYTENVEVTLNTSLLLSKSGNLGAQADYSTAKVDETALADLADTLMAQRQRGAQKPRHPFSFRMHFPALEQPSLESLSREQRLAGLFKVWAVISYMDPHVGNASIDWDTALPAWIPHVEAAQSVSDYYDVMQRLTAKLNDSHIGYLHSLLWTRRMLPLQMQSVEGKPIIVGTLPTLGESPPVRVGDEVLAIDGTSVAEMFARNAPLISASTPGARERDLVRSLNLTAEAKDAVDVLLQNENGPQTVRLKTIPRTTPPATAPVQLIEQTFGYISMGDVNEGQFESALSHFADAKGLILDVRGYPAFDASSVLIPRIIDNRLRTHSATIPVASTPDRRSRSVWELQGWYEPDIAHRYSGPIVALFDERTQSNAEHFLINLKGTGRVTFVGSTTAGTDGDITALYLPGGGSFAFTGSVVRFADGSKFQNVGVTPDVVVKPTIRGIRQGRDEVLQKGLEVLRSLIH
jgi:C-terminal processing protease CtpA/Prc